MPGGSAFKELQIAGRAALRAAPPCFWGTQLEIARRFIMVGCRLRWVASGAVVLLGDATANCQTPYNGGLKVAQKVGSSMGMCWESKDFNGGIEV